MVVGNGETPVKHLEISEGNQSIIQFSCGAMISVILNVLCKQIKECKIASS